MPITVCAVKFDKVDASANTVDAETKQGVRAPLRESKSCALRSNGVVGSSVLEGASYSASFQTRTVDVHKRDSNADWAPRLPVDLVLAHPPPWTTDTPGRQTRQDVPPSNAPRLGALCPGEF